MTNLQICPGPVSLKTDFFNSAAGGWDRKIKANDHSVLDKLFRIFPLSENERIIDVGSGTGISIPYYRRAGIRDLYSVELSPGMVEILRNKFPDLRIFHQSYLEPLKFRASVDKIVIYNTFPHFDDFEEVFRRSAEYLKPGGKLIIAHSLGRDALNALHRRKHHAVADDILPDKDFFHRMFSKHGFGEGQTFNGDWFYTAAERG